MKPFKSLTGVAAVLLGAALCPLEPSSARTARNFDYFEFGVVTVGETITAPALQLFSAKINSEKSGANWYALEGQGITFFNGPGGPYFQYMGKKVSCKYI